MCVCVRTMSMFLPLDFYFISTCLIFFLHINITPNKCLYVYIITCSMYITDTCFFVWFCLCFYCYYSFDHLIVVTPPSKGRLRRCSTLVTNTNKKENSRLPLVKFQRRDCIIRRGHFAKQQAYSFDSSLRPYREGLLANDPDSPPSTLTPLVTCSQMLPSQDKDGIEGEGKIWDRGQTQLLNRYLCSF